MIIKTLFCCLFVSFVLPGFSQYYSRNQIDSLKVQLEKQHGIPAINTVFALSEAYNSFQLDTGLIYADIGKQTSLNMGYRRGYYQSIYHKIRLKQQTTPQEHLLQPLEKCIEWFRFHQYPEDELRCEIVRTPLLRNLEGDDMAKLNAKKNLETAIKLGNKHLLALSWHAVHEFKPLYVDKEIPKGSLDSALTYYRQIKDSARIMKIQLDKSFGMSVYDGINISMDALRISRKWGNLKVMSDAAWFVGYGYIRIQKLDSSMHYLQMSLNYSERYGSVLLRENTYYMMAYANRRSDHYRDALKFSIKELDLCDRYGFYSNKGGILKNIGDSHLQLGEYEFAAAAFLQSIELARKYDKEAVLHATQLALGDLYALTQDYEKAEAIYLEEMDWMNESLSEPEKSRKGNHIYNRLARIYELRKDYKTAMNYYELASKEGEKGHRLGLIETKLAMVNCYLDQDNIKIANNIYEYLIERVALNFLEKNNQFLKTKGRLLVFLGKYKEGAKVLETYLLNSEKIDINEGRQEAYFYLYEAYKGTRQYNKSLLAFESYKEIDDSLRASEVVDNIVKMETKHEISLKEVEITDLEQKQELSDLKLDQQNSELELRQLYIVVLAIGAILIAFIGFWLFRRFRHKKEQEKVELELVNLQTQQKAEIAEVKNVLFANVSHEFRTPLTLIQIPIQSYRDQVAEEDKPIFNAVLRNTDQLLKMIDELLDLGKMESGTVELQKSVFDLSRFSTQIKANFSPLFKDKNIQFSWKNELSSYSFEGDENRIKIVLNNLLKNAYSHTPEGGEITGDIQQINGSSTNGMQITISNTGTKIAEKDLPNIFDRYYRANEESYIGNGIGLSLSRQIVEMHQGEITVVNEESGVSFQIKLPGELLSIETVEIVEPRVIPSNGENGVSQVTNGSDSYRNGAKENEDLANLLVVEDNAEMRLLLNNVLKDDYNLRFAENGEVGEQMALEHQPDLVLSDVMMPKKDGFELLNALKSNIGTSHIPVILLTARADADSRISGLDQDADDYMGKPFDPTELKARINNLLRQRKNLHKLFSENPLIYSKEIQCTPLDAKFLDNARTILDNNFDNGEFSLNEFCSELALNRNSVHNKIKALTNQSIAEYIKNFRLEKAVKMLIETTMSMTDIYVGAGFNSPQAFNKAFKKRFDSTPSEYRNVKQQVN